jgi:hypothetical protein
VIDDTVGQRRRSCWAISANNVCVIGERPGSTLCLAGRTEIEIGFDNAGGGISACVGELSLEMLSPQLVGLSLLPDLPRPQV